MHKRFTGAEGGKPLTSEIHPLPKKSEIFERRENVANKTGMLTHPTEPQKVTA